MIEKKLATTPMIKPVKPMTRDSLTKRTKPKQVQTPDPNAANVPIIFAGAQSGFKNDTAADECSNTDAPSSLPKTYFIFSRQMLLPYVAANSCASFR